MQRGPVAYVFNSDGFLAQRGADMFQYNTRGQPIQATVCAQPITYAYDGQGLRVSRTDDLKLLPSSLGVEGKFGVNVCMVQRF